MNYKQPTSPNGIVEFHSGVNKNGIGWDHFVSCMEVVNNILHDENVKHIDVEKWIKLSEDQHIGFNEKRIKPDILVDNKRAYEIENIYPRSKKIYKKLLKRLGIDLTVVLNIHIPKSMLGCTEVKITSCDYEKSDNREWNYLIPEEIIYDYIIKDNRK